MVGYDPVTEQYILLPYLYLYSILRKCNVKMLKKTVREF